MLPVPAETILDDIRLLIVVIAPDGTIRYVNAEVTRRSGEHASDIVGRPFSAMKWWTYKPGAASEVDRAVKQAIAGRSARFEIDVQISPTQRINVDFEVRPARDANGSIVGIVAEGRDMTDQRAIERTLREAQFRYRTVADFTVDWEFWLHPAGHFLYVSPSCQRLVGHTPDDFMHGRVTLTSVAHPEDRRRVGDLLTEAFSGTTKYSQTFRLVRRDGLVRWASLSWQPVHDENGKFMGVRGSIRDVTDLMRAEEELQRSVEAYRTLARHFPQGLVALLDRDLRFIVCDGPALDLLPYQYRTLVGRRIQDVLDRRLLSLVEPIVLKATAGEEVADILSFGESAWLLHLTPIRDQQGRIAHIIASAIRSPDEWIDGSEPPPAAPRTYE
jgi:PAS domain S-box-containing protein